MKMDTLQINDLIEQAKIKCRVQIKLDTGGDVLKEKIMIVGMLTLSIVMKELLLDEMEKEGEDR